MTSVRTTNLVVWFHVLVALPQAAAWSFSIPRLHHQRRVVVGPSPPLIPTTLLQVIPSPSLDPDQEDNDMEFPEPILDVRVSNAPNEQVPAILDAVWQKDERWTAAYRTFADTQPQAAGKGVEVTQMSQSLLDDDTASPHVVTRKEQRDVVECAFQKSRRLLHDATVTITVRGSPGIGKSWASLIYIKTLMNQDAERRRPILFEKGQNNQNRSLLLFMSEGDEAAGAAWTVYRLKEGINLPAEWLDCSVLDVVIDPPWFPPTVEPTPSRLISSRGHRFIPVSLDDRHLGSAFNFKASSEMTELVLGPWDLEELKVAFPYMVFNEPLRVFQTNKPIFDKTLFFMEENYYILGGLPRYLKDNNKNRKRIAEITPEKAETHAPVLLNALAQGTSFFDSTSEKLLTRFFTLRAGEDENGYNPNRLYATLDFVSPGAAKAAGKIILQKIHKDIMWRNQRDASDIGLAFERTVLIFLSLGEAGMRKIGIKTRCRKLLGSGVAGTEQGVNVSEKLDENNVLFSTTGNHPFYKINESPDAAAFEDTVKANGKGMAYEERSDALPMLKSSKSLHLPPDGYCNVDAMVGADLGLQTTLQKTHTVSGPEYIRQRKSFGLSEDDPFSLVFIVPPERFDNGWKTIQQFHWSSEAGEAATSRKRRKVATTTGGSISSNVATISESDKRKARSSICQYVMTLEFDE